jgi:hypothetical protein
MDIFVAKPQYHIKITPAPYSQRSRHTRQNAPNSPPKLPNPSHPIQPKSCPNKKKQSSSPAKPTTSQSPILTPSFISIPQDLPLTPQGKNSNLPTKHLLNPPNTHKVKPHPESKHRSRLHDSHQFPINLIPLPLDFNLDAGLLSADYAAGVDCCCRVWEERFWGVEERRWRCVAEVESCEACEA